MTRTVYIRVSTEKQNYDRQIYKMREYFTNHGMRLEEAVIVSEKITSHTSFTERKIYDVLNEAEEGDTIYVCQLDRLGRSIVDIIELVDFAMKRGVKIKTIDNDMSIENKSTMGKLYLCILAAMAETERELRAERCQAGIDAAKEEIKKNGYRFSRLTGKIQTKWGNAKGCDMTGAQEASALVRSTQAIEWKEKSVAYQWVLEQVAQGRSRNEIITEFNRLHKLQPEIFCTRSGKPLSKGTLSHWLRDTNPMSAIS